MKIKTKYIKHPSGTIAKMVTFSSNGRYFGTITPLGRR